MKSGSHGPRHSRARGATSATVLSASALVCALAALALSLLEAPEQVATASPSAVGLLSTSQTPSIEPRQETGLSAPVHRAPAERVQPSTEQDDQRLADIEGRLEALEALLDAGATPAGGIPMHDPRAAVDALNRLAQRVRAVAEPGEARELFEGRVEFLETYPDHELAEDQLIHLMGDAVLAGAIDEGLAKLELYAPKVGLSPTLVTRERAALYFAGQRLDEARAEYRRLAEDPLASEHQQSQGAFWAAYADLQAGRPNEARAAFQDLVHRFEHSTSEAVLRTVEGARDRLVARE